MKKFIKSKLAIEIIMTSFGAILVIAGVVGATTIGTNILTTGTLTVDTDTLYVDVTNNKVGVGTTTPFATLSIDTDSAINPFVIGSSTAGTLLTVDASGNLVVDTNTLYVDATNNKVGIGTSTPSAMLSAGVTGSVSSATTTIDFAKPCFRMTAEDGTMLYLYLKLNANAYSNWATSTPSCF